jgi:hypothetical protein
MAGAAGTIPRFGFPFGGTGLGTSSVGQTPKAGFPFGDARSAAAFPFAAAQGIGPGVVAGFGWTGWAIAFVVLFFIGIVFWQVWGAVSPYFSAVGAPGMFW